MGNYLHRTTKQYLQSVSPNDLPESLVNYIEEPDLSAVAGVSSIYWTITGDVVTEMLQAEKDAVDAQILSDVRDGTANTLDDVEGINRQVAQAIIREVNILRALHSLPDRTLAQFKTQLRSDLGT